MKVSQWVLWTLIVTGLAMVALGIYAVGSLSEPSAVGRMRTALYVIGVVGIVIGNLAWVLAAWRLIRRRT